MKLRTVTPREAWEEVARLKIAIDFNRKNSTWCACSQVEPYSLGWGASPLEAVGHLLERIGEAANEKAKEVTV